MDMAEIRFTGTWRVPVISEKISDTARTVAFSHYAMYNDSNSVAQCEAQSYGDQAECRTQLFIYVEVRACRAVNC